ncbi:MAG: RNA-binding domain-containing protein [Pseudomonadota bacterium]
MGSLDDLIAGGEALAVEFKSDVNDTELVETVVCLANRGGGTLLVGVDDDGTIKGARPRNGRITDPRRVEALISNSTRPSLGVQAAVEEAQGKPVLIIKVPAAIVPTGTSSGRYLRRALGGDGRPACVPFFVFETTGHGHLHDPASAVVPSATWGDLDSLEIERFRRFVRESGGRGDNALVDISDEDLCRALGGLDANGAVRGVRKVALLLFGREESLRRLMPTHEVAWQVLEGLKVLENEIRRWPLLRSFEDIVQRFRVRNRSTEIVDAFRTEIPDFAEDAFREALANAMTHRDYAQLGAIHVQWTDEGIRIDNPGGFPEGVRLDNLLVTPPRPRNLLLADAFKRAGIVERTGRGVDTIFYGQLRYGRSVPRYGLSTETSVTVVLPGEPANRELVKLVTREGRAGRPLSLRELLVLSDLQSARSVTAIDVARLIQTETDEAAARNVLGRLVEAGFVEARGAARNRSYHLSSATYRALGDRAGYVRTAGFEPLQQEQMVLRFVREHGRITRRETAELCQMSLRQAAHLLKKMRNNKLIRAAGQGRKAHYVAM